MHAFNDARACTAVKHKFPAGKEPVSRKFQSLTTVGSQMVMFGGQSLEDNADLNDLFFLSKVQPPILLLHAAFTTGLEASLHHPIRADTVSVS